MSIGKQTELSWNHSSTDFTEFLNVSHATIEPIVVEQSFKWTNEEIARMLQIIIRPILFLSGTVGNCLTFYVMKKTGLKDVSSCFYMSLLALADTRKCLQYSGLLVNTFHLCVWLYMWLGMCVTATHTLEIWLCRIVLSYHYYVWNRCY